MTTIGDDRDDDGENDVVTTHCHNCHARRVWLLLIVLVIMTVVMVVTVMMMVLVTMMMVIMMMMAVDKLSIMDIAGILSA